MSRNRMSCRMSLPQTPVPAPVALPRVRFPLASGNDRRPGAGKSGGLHSAKSGTMLRSSPDSLLLSNRALPAKVTPPMLRLSRMKIETSLDHQAILVNHPNPLISLSASQRLPPSPAAFCIVQDRSGSMGGPPLEHAKAAASELPPPTSACMLQSPNREILHGILVVSKHHGAQ